jgi:hypothetical protein
MPLSRAGLSASTGGVGALARPAALLLSLALGACSAAGPATQSANLYATRDQGTGSATHAAPLVEIEGDGLESQRPPRRRVDEAPTPDDPTQPYSPNYGSVPAPAQAPPRQPV